MFSAAAVSRVPPVPFSMSHPVRVLLPGSLFLSLVLLPTHRADACSVFFQARGWKRKSGLLPGEGEEEGEERFEKNDSKRLDLFLSWTPIDRVTLTLDLPSAFNEITEVEGDERTTSTLSGFREKPMRTWPNS